MMLCDVICGLGPMYGLLWNKNMKKPKIVKSLKRSDLGKSLLDFLTETYERPLCIEQTHRISQDHDLSFPQPPQKILSLSGRPKSRGKRPKKTPFHHLPSVLKNCFPYIYIYIYIYRTVVDTSTAYESPYGCWRGASREAARSIHPKGDAFAYLLRGQNRTFM